MTDTLTRHQREVFRRVARLAERRGGLVKAEHIGSPGACRKLIAKGYIEVALVEHGPRGGEYPLYRLTDAGRVVYERQRATASASRRAVPTRRRRSRAH